MRKGINSTLDEGQTPVLAYAIDTYNQSVTGEQTQTLCAYNGSKHLLPAVAQRGVKVRRLTPLEAERLQGFPDEYTNVRHRGKPPMDGPRYKVLGNAWCVPVVRWVGQRIEAVDKL